MAKDFSLSDAFVDSYRSKEIPWGYKDAAGNALGEISYLRTYSRMVNEFTGEKETWVDTCRRVIEGMFSIQKRHCRQNHIEWKNDKAQRTAKDAFDRLFNMKWLPAGRGLWAMGAPIVMEDGNSAPLQSCAFISTDESVVAAMTFLFDASMLGVGVGFDAEGANRFDVTRPIGAEHPFVIPDSREGWVNSLRILMLGFIENQGHGVLPEFDYSQIRPAGQPIKRFGGVASGPEPLKRMHAQIRAILEKRVGQKLTMTDIADIGNIIGTCVVAGNVRRSAEIFFVDRNSADFEDFLNLKNYEVNPERQAWGYMSNNSIRVNVGDDLSPLMDGIKLNGEPGLAWMDMTRAYGRLADKPDYKDIRVAGYNPCFPADTLLATEEGWVSFGDAYLSKTPQRILVDGRVSFEESVPGEENVEDWKIDLSIKHAPKIMDASEVFLTQRNADIVKVVTSSGIELRCTPDHLIATKDGMVRADELTPEHKVLITRGILPEGGLPPLDRRENIDGFLMGLIAGDGYIAVGKETEKAYIDLWGEDRDIVPTLTKWLDDLHAQFKGKYVSGSNRPFTAYNVEDREDRNLVRIKSSFLAAYLNGEYGFNKATKRKVPQKFVSFARSEAARAYVAGLAFADGTINKYNKVGSSSIRISQTSRELLMGVQRILLANGIFSSVYKRRAGGTAEIRGKEFESAPLHELVVMMNKFEYTKFVGFGFGHKKELAESMFVEPSRKQAAYTTIVSVEDDGIEDVYCLKEPVRRVLSANGITARRCAEQPLESAETCNLVETFVNNCDDLDDFIQTLKVAYLYGKTVTLLPTKWEKTNTIMQRNRRIGLSASGVADFVDIHGMAALRTQLDTGFKYILELDEKYSEWLCIRESIRHTTMKPSGTISILAGSSPGTHWTPGGEFFIRRITFGKADPLFVALKNAGYTHENLEYDPNSAVILFPIHSKSKRSSSEVPAYEKIHLAAEIQHWWSDNAVSCTVDFTQEEAETIPTLLAMYDGKLKGISFLPQVDGGAYKHMPYERITKEEFEDMAKDISKVDFSLAYTDGQEAEGEKFCSNDVCEVAAEASTLNTGGLIDIAAMLAEEEADGREDAAVSLLTPGEVVIPASMLNELIKES